MIVIPFLDENPDKFPAPESALKEPDGLLAGGGDLSQARLLNAYRHGIFPWYQDDQPILWWSPSIRAELQPDKLRVTRSLRKSMRNILFTITADKAFDEVIQACAAPRAYVSNTWITAEMMSAYVSLHRAGYAHSIEVWQEGLLVGGLYGIAIGGCYFGESMFSRERDTSKIAFVALIHYLSSRNFRLIDCQMMTPHLESLGVTAISRTSYLTRLQETLHATEHENAYLPGTWQFETNSVALAKELKNIGTTGNPCQSP